MKLKQLLSSIFFMCDMQSQDKLNFSIPTQSISILKLQTVLVFQNPEDQLHNTLNRNLRKAIYNIRALIVLIMSPLSVNDNINNQIVPTNVCLCLFFDVYMIVRV